MNRITLIFVSLTLSLSTFSQSEESGNGRLAPGSELFEQVFRVDWERYAARRERISNNQGDYQYLRSRLRTAQTLISGLFFKNYENSTAHPNVHPLPATLRSEVHGIWNPVQCPEPFWDGACQGNGHTRLIFDENGARVQTAIAAEIEPTTKGLHTSRVALYREKCTSTQAHPTEVEFEMTCERAYKRFGGGFLTTTEGDLEDAREMAFQMNWSDLQRALGFARRSLWHLIGFSTPTGDLIPVWGELTQNHGISEGYEFDHTQTACRLVDQDSQILVCFSRARRIGWLGEGRLQYFVRGN